MMGCNVTETGKKGILIVDDHPLVRNGLARTVGQESDLSVCGLAESAEEALIAIKQHKPDLIIVDISLKGSSGLDLVREIKRLYPDLPTLVLSMHAEEFYAERALHAGARGYITKESPIENLLDAIRRVLNLGVYVSDAMAGKMLSRMSTGAKGDAGGFTEDVLTDREMEVLECLGGGMTTRDIAEKWGRSIRTVETHCANIKRKLNLDSARELLQRAIQWVQAGTPCK